MWFLWATVALVTYVLGSTLASLLSNVQKARQTGLPFVVSPVARINPFWVLLQKALKPQLARLPFGWGSFVRYSTQSWWFEDKYRLHQEHGKVFLSVAPGLVELHCADNVVNQQIFARMRDFEKPPNLIKATKLFGESVLTTTNKEWMRHRRITTAPFNEENNRLVWDESVRQTTQATLWWSRNHAEGIAHCRDDWMTITLNILATAAFAESWKFEPSSPESPATRADDQTKSSDGKAGTSTYRQALTTLAGCVALLVLTPSWLYHICPSILPLSCLPGGLKKYVESYHHLEGAMQKMVQTRRERIKRGDLQADGTFLTSLILRSEHTEKGEGGFGLSDDELYGNLFSYTIAGHETTAGVLTYAMHLLAALPEWQTWAQDEIDLVCPVKGDDFSPRYSDVFGQLTRCLAIMLETLRLYAPIHAINKASIGTHGHNLTIDGREVHIPGGTMVIPNVMASHTLPEYWGEGSLQWKPDRWIAEKTKFGPGGPAARSPIEKSTETIVNPPGGKTTYFPWSDGGRYCPGKKFAQVEFVACLLVLLRNYRIEVVRNEGEEEEQARNRCLAAIEDSETQITLQMLHPESVRLRLVPR